MLSKDSILYWCSSLSKIQIHFTKEKHNTYMVSVQRPSMFLWLRSTICSCLLSVRLITKAAVNFWKSLCFYTRSTEESFKICLFEGTPSPGKTQRCLYIRFNFVEKCAFEVTFLIIFTYRNDLTFIPSWSCFTPLSINETKREDALQEHSECALTAG